MKPPIPPPCRIIREGGCGGICDICGSSLKRRWFGLGKVIGCLQPKCWNWHGWSHLPVGSNRPSDLYGAPEKPPYVSQLPTPRHYPPMPKVNPPAPPACAICERLKLELSIANKLGQSFMAQGNGFSTAQLRAMFDRYEHDSRGMDPDRVEVERFLEWIDRVGQ